MTAEKLSSNVLGDRWEANLSGWQILYLRNIIPVVDTLEDPNKGRSVHIQARKKTESCINPMPRRENVISNFVSSVETFFVRKLHEHNIIIIQALHIYYVMWIKRLSQSYNREVGL